MFVSSDTWPSAGRTPGFGYMRGPDHALVEYAGNHPAERVTFLGEPYELGDTRAVMIEGPSREALELVETAQVAVEPRH